MEWYFEDDSGIIQGPFSNKNMREWYDNGYLNEYLKISCGSRDTKSFRTLIEWFPNPAEAFLNDGMKNSFCTWYFIDRNNEQQGPFSDQQMRRWFESGYFSHQLLIHNAASRDKSWKRLNEYFPTIENAFRTETETKDKHHTSISKSSRKDKNVNLDSRLTFSKELPAVPQFQNVEKKYPSES